MTPEMELHVSPKPHLWRGFSTNKIMNVLLLALVFPTIAAVLFYGFRAITMIIVSVAFAIATEITVKKLRGRPFIWDGSAAITGLMLALILPATMPLWMVAVGAVFSIAIVKEAFGGIGYNIFNPTLGGRAFLTACFGTQMSTWVSPMGFAPDAITSATPLSAEFVAGPNIYTNLFLGSNIAGTIGGTSVLAMLIGLAVLIVFKIIDWKVPVVFIATVALFSLITGQDPLFQIMAGGLIFGAVFMATDPVTSPVTHWGRVIFALGCGLIVVIIRQYGGLDEGVAYAILFMNALTPFIDRYVKVKPYGFQKAVNNA